MNEQTPSIQLLDFVKSDATRDLLAHAGITDDYEMLIQSNTLDILRRSVPECEIESIRFLAPEGCRAGGVPIEEGSSKIILQELNISFELEIIARADDERRYRLSVTFEFDCHELDRQPKTAFKLTVNGQGEIAA